MKNRWDDRLDKKTVLEVSVFWNKKWSNSVEWFIILNGCYREFWTIKEEEKPYLCFGDGTLLNFEYQMSHDGIYRWIINPVTKGYSFIDHESGTDQKHSDTVTLGCDIKWVLFGHTLTRMNDGSDSIST